MPAPDDDPPATPAPGLSPRPRPVPIATTVLTGFLGAGKTTLLNRLVRDPAFQDTALVINEFGEVGIDHLLVEHPADGVVELAAGCICCTIRGDLVAALENLLRARDNGRVRPFTRCVIETTGLADPAPVLHTLMLHPYLPRRYRLDGVVTVVDAVNGLATLGRHGESVRQVAVADRLIVTKRALAAPEGLAALEAALARLAPGVPRFPAEAIAPEAVLAPALWSPERLGALGPEAHAAHGAALDLNRHGAHIRAFALERAAPIKAAALDLFLDLLRAAHGPRLLRVKGLVAVAEDPGRPIVIHAVQHVLHPPAQLEAWPDGEARTRLVFIVDGLEPRDVEALYGAFAGEPAPDRPDAAALTDNPLALGSSPGASTAP